MDARRVAVTLGQRPDRAGAIGQPCPTVDELAAVGRSHGLDAVGVAAAVAFDSTLRDLRDRKSRGLHGGMNFTYRSPERSTDPDRALPGAQWLVVGARSYRSTVPQPASQHPGEPDQPTGSVAAYARGDHYAALRGALDAVAELLRRYGWRTRVLVDDNALVDREAAYRAGLGWYGKNSNLLLPGAGSWFVLGSVVTDAPLRDAGAGEPVPDGCGGCTRCLDSCPTGAIVAPGVVDARRCLAWLLQVDGPFPREYRVALGDRIYGCDDCQEVCPPNRRVMRARPPEGGSVAAASAGSDDVDDAGMNGADDVAGAARADLLEMLAMSDEQLLARYGRWYIPRRQPRYLRRNALVVLGNVAPPGDERVASSLRRALTDDDPLVRGHAVWAARRLGRADLLAEVAGLKHDPDPLVRQELEAPVEMRKAAP
jgi:epoxyqueuosine reductase